MDKEIVYVIEYKVDVEYANIADTLDRLRETGGAKVVDVRLEKKD